MNLSLCPIHLFIYVLLKLYLPTLCPIMPYLNLLGRLLHNVADAIPLADLRTVIINIIEKFPL